MRCSNTPGVSTQKYDSDRTEFSARGFAITNFQYDGVNIPYDGVYGENPNNSDDAASLDRIEVIKGATGLMTGAGDPAATVNLVRKKPTKDFKASVSGTVGSWDNYRTEGDISGSLNDTGSVRGRFVGAYAGQGLLHRPLQPEERPVLRHPRSRPDRRHPADPGRRQVQRHPARQFLDR